MSEGGGRAQDRTRGVPTGVRFRPRLLHIPAAAVRADPGIAVVGPPYSTAAALDTCRCRRRPDRSLARDFVKPLLVAHAARVRALGRARLALCADDPIAHREGRTWCWGWRALHPWRRGWWWTRGAQHGRAWAQPRVMCIRRLTSAHDPIAAESADALAVTESVAIAITTASAVCANTRV